MKPAIIIVCGPTASGKSQLAAELAAIMNGVVINADSMQVYRELRILTARPTIEEEQKIPHALYGMLPGSQPCSAGKWLPLAQTEIDKALGEGRLPIVTGGTGLYIKTLLEGISPIPDILPEIREQATVLFNDIGGHQFHELLKLRDPEGAVKIRPSDRQRLIRAYEVIEQTGYSLIEWQEMESEIPYPEHLFINLQLEIPRELLYARCDARFTRMVEEGAVEEVETLISQKLSPDAPIMKAVGVPELAGYLRGELSIDEAIQKACQMTRNYAKRQLTWFRNQMGDNQLIPFDFAARPDYVQDLAKEIGDSVDRKQQNL